MLGLEFRIILFVVRSQIDKLAELGGVFPFGNLRSKETMVFVLIFIGIYRPSLYLHEFIVGYGLRIPIYVLCICMYVLK